MTTFAPMPPMDDKPVPFAKDFAIRNRAWATLDKDRHHMQHFASEDRAVAYAKAIGVTVIGPFLVPQECKEWKP